MKQITAYKTLDGQVFECERKAFKHAEKRYADEMLKHARALCGLRYTETAAYLDSHASELAGLVALRDDCKQCEVLS